MPQFKVTLDVTQLGPLDRGALGNLGGKWFFMRTADSPYCTLTRVADGLEVEFDPQITGPEKTLVAHQISAWTQKPEAEILQELTPPAPTAPTAAVEAKEDEEEEKKKSVVRRFDPDAWGTITAAQLFSRTVGSKEWGEGATGDQKAAASRALGILEPLDKGGIKNALTTLRSVEVPGASESETVSCLVKIRLRTDISKDEIKIIKSKNPSFTDEQAKNAIQVQFLEDQKKALEEIIKTLKEAGLTADVPGEDGEGNPLIAKYEIYLKAVEAEIKDRARLSSFSVEDLRWAGERDLVEDGSVKKMKPGSREWAEFCHCDRMKGSDRIVVDTSLIRPDGEIAGLMGAAEELHTEAMRVIAMDYANASSSGILRQDLAEASKKQYDRPTTRSVFTEGNADKKGKERVIENLKALEARVRGRLGAIAEGKIENGPYRPSNMFYKFLYFIGGAGLLRPFLDWKGTDYGFQGMMAQRNACFSVLKQIEEARLRLTRQQEIIGPGGKRAAEREDYLAARGRPLTQAKAPRTLPPGPRMPEMGRRPGDLGLPTTPVR